MPTLRAMPLRPHAVPTVILAGAHQTQWAVVAPLAGTSGFLGCLAGLLRGTLCACYPQHGARHSRHLTDV